MNNLPSESPVLICTSLFTHVHCQTLTQPERNMVYKIFQKFLLNKIEGRYFNIIALYFINSTVAPREVFDINIIAYFYTLSHSDFNDKLIICRRYYHYLYTEFW